MQYLLANLWCVIYFYITSQGLLGTRPATSPHSGYSGSQSYRSTHNNNTRGRSEVSDNTGARRGRSDSRDSSSSRDSGKGMHPSCYLNKTPFLLHILIMSWQYDYYIYTFWIILASQKHHWKLHYYISSFYFYKMWFDNCFIVIVQQIMIITLGLLINTLQGFVEVPIDAFFSVLIEIIA